MPRVQMRRLSDTSQQLVVDSGSATRAPAQDLFAQIALLERTARLYQVLSDPKLLEPSYREHDAELSARSVGTLRLPDCATRRGARPAAAPD